MLTNFSKPKRLEVVNRPRRKLLEERTKNLLKDKYFENMCVPGYTGGLTAIDGDGDLLPRCRNTERLILEGVGRRFQIRYTPLDHDLGRSGERERVLWKCVFPKSKMFPYLCNFHKKTRVPLPKYCGG